MNRWMSHVIVFFFSYSISMYLKTELQLLPMDELLGTGLFFVIISLWNLKKKSSKLLQKGFQILEAFAMAIPLYFSFRILTPDNINLNQFFLSIFGILAILLLVKGKWTQGTLKNVLMAFMITYQLCFLIYFYTDLSSYYILPFALLFVYSLIAKRKVEVDVGGSFLFGIMAILLAHATSFLLVGVKPTRLSFSISFVILLFYAWQKNHNPNYRTSKGYTKGKNGKFNYYGHNSRDNYERSTEITDTKPSFNVWEIIRQSEIEKKESVFQYHGGHCKSCNMDAENCLCSSSSHCYYCGKSFSDCDC